MTLLLPKFVVAYISGTANKNCISEISQKALLQAWWVILAWLWSKIMQLHISHDLKMMHSYNSESALISFLKCYTMKLAQRYMQITCKLYELLSTKNPLLGQMGNVGTIVAKNYADSYILKSILWLLCLVWILCVLIMSHTCLFKSFSYPNKSSDFCH